MVLYIADLKKSFVAAKLRHYNNTKVAKLLNLVPANNSNNKVLVSTCGNSTACCLVTKPGSLLLPPPLFSKPLPPPQLAQHTHNTKHLD